MINFMLNLIFKKKQAEYNNVTSELSLASLGK